MSRERVGTPNTSLTPAHQGHLHYHMRLLACGRPVQLRETYSPPNLLRSKTDARGFYYVVRVTHADFTPSVNLA